MKSNIEKEKINLIIENSARLLSNDTSFNCESINFLKYIYNEYERLVIQKDNTVNDMHIYEKILDIINDKVGYFYKISRDLKYAINNMKSGIYNPLDVEKIENDFMYIGFIIDTTNVS